VIVPNPPVIRGLSASIGKRIPPVRSSGEATHRLSHAGREQLNWISTRAGTYSDRAAWLGHQWRRVTWGGIWLVASPKKAGLWHGDPYRRCPALAWVAGLPLQILDSGNPAGRPERDHPSAVTETHPCCGFPPNARRTPDDRVPAARQSDKIVRDSWDKPTPSGQRRSAASNNFRLAASCNQEGVDLYQIRHQWALVSHTGWADRKDTPFHFWGVLAVTSSGNWPGRIAT